MTNASNANDSSTRGRMRWLWQEGLARRVVAEKGARRPVDMPLTAFLIAAVLAPWLVALGGVAGILLGYQFRVDRDEPADSTGGASTEAAPDAPSGGGPADGASGG